MTNERGDRKSTRMGQRWGGLAGLKNGKLGQLEKCAERKTEIRRPMGRHKLCEL